MVKKKKKKLSPSGPLTEEKKRQEVQTTQRLNYRTRFVALKKAHKRSISILNAGS